MNLNIYKLFFAISLGLLIGCSPEDPIESDITNYAVFQMEGKQYSLHQLGEDYVDPGVIATEDGNEIEVEVTGEVDSNTPGLYILTYSATNTDGYSASTVRYVGVGDKETATNRDLTGEYLSGNGGENEVSKFADGYYTNSDALPPNEIGIYMMESIGLSAVSNPNELLIPYKEEFLSGHAIACILEGSRPLMIEVQALVSSAVYGTPQRTSNGFNSKRLNMLLAVLEKRAGFTLGTKDVFINITGGISVEDPSIDLAVITAILSSYHDISVSQEYCFSAEIGLSGEIRPVSKIDQRIKECSKLGYKNFVTSKSSKIQKSNNKTEIISLSKIEDLINYLFG